MRTTTQTTGVSLAQRYWNFEWDEAANRAAYGPLASRDGVGANLRVRLGASDERDLQPGLVLTKKLLDHRALFDDEPCFRRLPSTLEAITIFLRDRLARTSAGWRALDIYDGPAVRCRARFDRDELEFSERLGNLTFTRRVTFANETGLGVTRGDARRAVHRVAPRFAKTFAGARDAGARREAWGRALFAEFQNEMPQLVALAVDHGPLGVQRVLAAEI